MMPIGTEILTTAQMRAIESAAISSGAVSGAALMRRAGAAVAGQIRLRWPKPGRVTVMCGPGNNGGDGYVIANLLHEAGWQVRVMGSDNLAGADAHAMKAEWLAIGPLLPLCIASLADSDVYVDAIFGTGLTRPPKGDIAELLAYIGGSGGDRNHFRKRLVAVDCPSGLCLDSGVNLGAPRDRGAFAPHARLTVAFDSPKPGHLLELGPILCGQLVIADIGLRHWGEMRPDGRGQRPMRVNALWPSFPVADSRRDHMPVLAKNSSIHQHKFTHGHGVVVAGGPGQGGAARLAARAALRVGAGVVTICPPRSARQDHVGSPDALMCRVIDDASDLSVILADERVNAICIGPGCGVERAGALLPALLRSKRALVLDADALTAISMAPELADALHDRCVLTPHGGEFQRLFPDIAARLRGPDAPKPLPDGDYTKSGFAAHSEAQRRYDQGLAEMRGPAYSRLDAATDAASRRGAVVLLKGPDTVVAAPDGCAIIHSAFDVPWLATAGAGDVLAGIITGLMARGVSAFDAAGTGALLHAKAARAFGPGLIADDLPEMLPRVIAAMTAGAERE